MNAAVDYGVGRAISAYNVAFNTQPGTKAVKPAQPSNPIAAYRDVFGEAVPKQVIRQAASRLQLEALETELSQQILFGEPVYNWHTFMIDLSQPSAQEVFECWGYRASDREELV